MKTKILAIIALLPTISIQLSTCSAATTINSTNRFAYGANLGWMDWRGDTNNGAVIGEYVCSGYIYSANVGWIDLGSGAPSNGIQYQNNSAADHGVNHDGLGNLRGYAYGANIGWINFENTGNAKVDLATGKVEQLGLLRQLRLDLIEQQLRVCADGYNGFSDKNEYLADTNPNDATSNPPTPLYSSARTIPTPLPGPLNPLDNIACNTAPWGRRRLGATGIFQQLTPTRSQTDNPTPSRRWNSRFGVRRQLQSVGPEHRVLEITDSIGVVGMSNS